MSRPHGLALEIVDDRIELVEADAILLPVDGQVCRLGGAVANALRLALPPEERADEMEYVEDELSRMRPLPHPQARAIDGVARSLPDPRHRELARSASARLGILGTAPTR